MITRKTILPTLINYPPGKTNDIGAMGKTPDIIHTILKRSPAAIDQAKKFAYLFQGNTDAETIQNIDQFLKKQIRYSADQTDQNILLPSALIRTGQGDCKSYALFSFAILVALGWENVGFEFASYDQGKTPTHVYTIAQKKKHIGLMARSKRKEGHKQNPHLQKFTTLEILRK